MLLNICCQKSGVLTPKQFYWCFLANKKMPAFGLYEIDPWMSNRPLDLMFCILTSNYFY